MPTWITPRRLGASAVLYAVFAGGWYLGQPLPRVGCDTFDEATAYADHPVTIAEPGDVSDDFSRVVTEVHQVVTYDFVSTEAFVPCDSWTPRPRLVAWLTGDWR